MSDNTPSNLFKNSLVLTTALAVIGVSSAAQAYNRRATLPSIEVHLEVLESLRQQATAPQRAMPAMQPQTAPQQQAAVPFGRPSKPLAAQPQQQPVRQAPAQQYVQQPAPQPVQQYVQQPVQQQPVVQAPMPVPAPQPIFIEPQPQPQVAQPTMPTEPKMANGKVVAQFEPSGEPTIASTRRVPSQQPVVGSQPVIQPAPAQRPVVQNYATYQPVENAQDPVAPEFTPREVSVNGPLRRPANNPVIPEDKPEIKTVVVEAPQEKPAEVKIVEAPKPEKKEPALTLAEETTVETSTEEMKVTEMNPALAPVKLPELPKPTKILTAEEEAALNAENEMPWTGEETVTMDEQVLEELSPAIEPPKLVQITEPEEKLELPALPGMKTEVEAEAELMELSPAEEPEPKMAELPDDLLPLEALPDHEVEAEAEAKAQEQAAIAEAQADAAKAAALKAEADAEAAEIAAEEAKEAELAAVKAAEEEKAAKVAAAAEAEAEAETETEAQAEADLTLAAEVAEPPVELEPIDESVAELVAEETPDDMPPPPPLVKKTTPKKEEGLFSGLTSKMASLLGKDEDKEIAPVAEPEMALPKLPKGALPLEEPPLTEEPDMALAEINDTDANAEAELTSVDELPGLPPLPSQEVDEVPVATAPNRALPSLSAIVSEDRRDEINKVEAEREAAAAKAKAAERDAKLAKAEAQAAAEKEAVKVAQAAAEAKEQSKAKLEETTPAEEMQIASLTEGEVGESTKTTTEELQAPEVGFDEYSRKQVRLFYGRDDKDVQTVMQPALEELVAEMKETSSAKLKIEAYAGNNLEDATVSSRMSLSRALALRAYFIEAGIDTDRVNVASMGNKSGRGPQERVDITVD